MQGINRLLNLILNIAVSVLLIYGLQGVINDLAHYMCNSGSPVSFTHIICMCAPVIKLLFVRLNTHDKYVPRIAIDVRHEGRMITREDKDGNV